MGRGVLMSDRQPKHPCPKCKASGRQTTAHKLTQYFQCVGCSFRWGETQSRGRVTVSYRVTESRDL